MAGCLNASILKLARKCWTHGICILLVSWRLKKIPLRTPYNIDAFNLILAALLRHGFCSLFQALCALLLIDRQILVVTRPKIWLRADVELNFPSLLSHWTARDKRL